MPEPNDAPCLPPGTTLSRFADGRCSLSPPLVQLLLQARSGFDWPAGTGPGECQTRILNLEATVNGHLMALAPATAHDIAVEVSSWAGNNANAHAHIVGATPAQQAQIQAAITALITPGRECVGIDALCNLPGISLVIASKIFRFCSPRQGAAVDRHASYFFNSLQVVGAGTATNFAREWANGCHTASRLATFSVAGYSRNKAQYFESYLPTLACIARAMNAIPAPFMCAATNLSRRWTPADVEMAAYYWWACNGAR